MNQNALSDNAKICSDLYAIYWSNLFVTKNIVFFYQYSSQCGSPGSSIYFCLFKKTSTSINPKLVYFELGKVCCKYAVFSSLKSRNSFFLIKIIFVSDCRWCSVFGLFAHYRTFVLSMI